VDPLPSRPVRRPGRPGGLRPAQWIAASFLLAILVGTGLLALPVSHAEGAEVGVLDALFTATSAVCVTGLVVVDTGAAFSRVGQVVILLLIQAGGLGILTLGALAALLVGSRVGYRQRMRLQAQVNALHVGGVVRLVRGILILVAAFEAVLTLILWTRYAPRHGLGEGLFQALFHAVSAFNNAGFSTYDASLIGRVGDVVLVGTILAGLVVGGLGHPVLIEVGRRLRGARRSLTLHARLALGVSAGLLAFGAVAVAALEWGNPATLGGLPPAERLLAALFQSATPRTAGFTTVEVAELRPATLVVTMLLMFIGGSPGSTAGGIKTVTFFVLAGSAWSWARGHGELELAGRRLATELAVRASVIAFLAAMVIVAGVVALLAFDARLGFAPLVFEAVSAFGTVGLSMGVTADLGAGSRLVVIALMVIGRLGPLTAALALVETPRAKLVRRPSEDVMIG
jgi:trk system potassium uptake protein TrkH